MFCLLVNVVREDILMVEISLSCVVYLRERKGDKDRDCSARQRIREQSQELGKGASSCYDNSAGVEVAGGEVDHRQTLFSVRVQRFPCFLFIFQSARGGKVNRR